MEKQNFAQEPTPVQMKDVAQTSKLDHQLRVLVKTERKITLEILMVIQTFDITRSYLELGYSSLFDYLTRGIGYSEGAAQRRISSARLLKQVPEIKSEIQSGKINLTQVALAQVAINSQEKSDKKKISVEKKSEILMSLKSKTSFETKKLLQSELPSYDPTPKTLVNPKQETVSVTLSFTQDQWTQVQELLAMNSHKVPDQKIESLLLRLAAQERKRRAVQVIAKDTAQPNPPTEEAVLKDVKSNQTQSPPLRRSPPIERPSAGKRSRQRKYISVSVKREIFAKAQNQCQFISPMTGLRCRSQHFLQTEHKIAVMLGGSDEIQNLRVFCQAHNFLAARQDGISKLVE